MASSEHPQTSHLTKEAPAETPVPLPPLPRTLAGDATKFLRRRGRLDGLLVALVLLFAFLVVSFPTINTDFFRHAAIGRLLLQGEYRFGVDPFVYTAGENYFVNHSWLFDLLLYGLYQLPTGGTVIVILKALLTVALAVVLLLAGRRAGQSLWIPALCTALAILVVSPRLYLYVQSICLSFLFLGVTVWLLTTAGTSAKRLWLLSPLFALWVNCDSWFFLGPLTVALYLVGGLFQQRWGSFSFSREPEASAAALNSGSQLNEKNSCLRTLGLVFAVGVAACLLNPHHVRALTLPPEFGLTAAGDLLEHDPQFSALFLSPLSKNYYQPYSGLSAAGLAYWPLLLLGLLSFVFAFSRETWPRLLVWLGFALMSLYNWRAIPFFAIVAGPITALNWLDFVARRLGTEPRLTRAWRSWALAGRALTLVLGLALVIATVPGWLQKSQPNGFFRIGWSVRIDPSLQEMGEAIHGWRQTSLLPDQPNWFNMNFEVANYLAWFAPGERVFLDQSLPYFRQAAEDYLTIRKGLAQEIEQDFEAVKMDWQKVLDDRHVRFWIYDNVSAHKADLVSRWALFTHPDQWTLCHLKGRIAIFAKRDRQQPASDPSTRLALDVKGAAFGPKAEKAPPRGVEPAPPREWWQMGWDAWWHSDPPPSSDREVLPLYDYRYQAVERPRQIDKHSRVWQGAVAASGIVGSIPGGPVPRSLVTLSWSCTYHDLFPPGAVQPTRQIRQSERPAMRVWGNYVGAQFVESPSLYLAVRAARRALVVDAEDGPTYFRLGQVYQHLRDLPQESQLRQLPPQTAPLTNTLRRTQMVAAFHNCLRFAVDDEKAAEAHEALYQVYARELRYFDAAVHHLRQALDKRTVLPPPSGMSPTQYNQALEQMSAQLAQLDGELGRRMDRYDVSAASKSGLEKVQAALQEGLSETALTVLEQEVDPNSENPAQLALVKVLTGVALDLGRIDKAQDLLVTPPDQPVKPEYLELYLRLAAARGDYAEADRHLDEASRYAWQPQPGMMRMPEPINQVAPLIGQVLLAEARHLMGCPCAPWVPNNLADIIQKPWLAQNSSDFWRRRSRLEAIINGLIAARQQGEWEFLRGWLALEAGHCGPARKHLQTARDLAVFAKNWAPEVDQLNAWYDLQQEGTHLQQLGFRHAILYDQSTRYLSLFREEQP
jgi:tetratricopeptide (TPR) repeat protein